MSSSKNIVCAGCSLLCEDIAILDSVKELKIFATCKVGAEKIKSIRMRNRLTNPSVAREDRLMNVTLEEAVETAAEILLQSKKPLLYGWSNASCETIRLGLRIAEKIKGIFDSTASLCQGFSIMTAKQKGMFAGTLEEVLDNADHVIFWGCNPSESFHRHASKYSVFPRGLHVPKGVENRTITTVEVRETKTVKISHNKLILKPSGDLELFRAVEATVKGETVVGENVAGIPLRNFFSFMRDLKNSRYIAIFYGLGLIGTGRAQVNLDALYSLVKTLNASGIKCISMPMAGHYNTVGCVETALKETGYPYAIDFSTNPPTHSPLQTSAIPMLQNGKASSALVVASDPVAHLPINVSEKLVKLPIIVLDYKRTVTVNKASVFIPVAVTGMESEGTAYRMDGKEMRLTPIFEPPKSVVSDEKILSMILSKISK